jgi:hypothetical protein
VIIAIAGRVPQASGFLTLTKQIGCRVPQALVFSPSRYNRVHRPFALVPFGEGREINALSLGRAISS